MLQLLQTHRCVVGTTLWVMNTLQWAGVPFMERQMKGGRKGLAGSVLSREAVVWSKCFLGTMPGCAPALRSGFLIKCPH